jgi:hypothetical protein
VQKKKGGARLILSDNVKLDPSFLFFQIEAHIITKRTRSRGAHTIENWVLLLHPPTPIPVHAKVSRALSLPPHRRQMKHNENKGNKKKDKPTTIEPERKEKKKREQTLTCRAFLFSLGYGRASLSVPFFSPFREGLHLCRGARQRNATFFCLFSTDAASATRGKKKKRERIL